MKRGGAVSHFNARNAHGFSLVEALVQLVVFMVIISSLILIFPWYEKTDKVILATSSMEFEVFLSELRNDLMDASAVTVIGSAEIQIKKKSLNDLERFYYIHYQYGNKRIKKTNISQRGTDIKLTHVKRCEFNIVDNKLVIEIQFTNNLRKERALVF